MPVEVNKGYVQLRYSLCSLVPMELHGAFRRDMLHSDLLLMPMLSSGKWHSWATRLVSLLMSWTAFLVQDCWIRLILEIDSSWSSAIALYNALQNVVFSALCYLISQTNQLSNLFSLHSIVVESCSHGFGTLVAIRKQGSQEDLGEACLISFPSKYCLYSCEWKGSKASKASCSWQWWNQGAEMHSKLYEKCSHSWGQRASAVDS